MGINHLEYNHALVGGAIYSAHGTIRNSLLSQNTVDGDGGALHVVGAEVILNAQVKFTYNLAENGGAMYFKNSASVALNLNNLQLTTSYNHASVYGGVIFNEDSVTPAQCLE